MSIISLLVMCSFTFFLYKNDISIEHKTHRIAAGIRNMRAAIQKNRRQIRSNKSESKNNIDIDNISATNRQRKNKPVYIAKNTLIYCFSLISYLSSNFLMRRLSKNL